MTTPTDIRFHDIDLDRIAGATGRIALFVTPDGKLDQSARKVNSLSKKAVERLAGSERFEKMKTGKAAEIAFPVGLAAEAVIVVKLPRRPSVEEARKAGAAIAKARGKGDLLVLAGPLVRAEEMALVDWPDAQKEQFLRMQFQAQHSYYHDQFRQATFDVIELKGDPVGRLYVDRRAQEIRIIDIALLPEYRGQGIGGEIMQSLLNEAVGSNRSVSIHVEQNNPALNLYRRLGFRHVSDEGVYYFMQWDADDEPRSSDQENTAS